MRNYAKDSENSKAFAAGNMAELRAKHETAPGLWLLSTRRVAVSRSGAVHTAARAATSQGGLGNGWCAVAQAAERNREQQPLKRGLLKYTRGDWNRDVDTGRQGQRAGQEHRAR